MKHKHYDLIVWWASDPENNIVQYKSKTYGCWTNVSMNHPNWDDHEEYRKKPVIVKRWKWAYALSDAGHEYEYISDGYYTEEEAAQKLASNKLVWKEKIEATEKEFTE